jgi:nucleoid-associated protein YgaU
MDYVIHMGDTLQSIAQKILGDASLWIDIAQANNLVYPFHLQYYIRWSCDNR